LREKQKYWEENLLQYNFFSMWGGLGLNPDLHGEGPVSNPLRCGTDFALNADNFEDPNNMYVYF
jgi:hypothetical protein